MQTIAYTGGHLDRAEALRKDPDWIVAQLAHPDSLVVPVWRSRNLILGLEGGNPTPTAVTCRGQSAADILSAAAEIAFLGLEDERAIFAADISGLEEAEALARVGRGDFVDLRQAGPLMDAREAALVAYARGMLHWHRQHRYCGRCGHATESQQGGFLRHCGNPDCGRDSYPRTDPVVIMLVEHRPAKGGPPLCLLGHHRRLPPGVVTTLAGFVEPGESLEEAVVREVLEEAGLRVRGVAYQASQPWPFPASLMLGFRARAEATALKIDEDELTEARWFTPGEIRTFGEWGDESAEFRLPRRDSIARFLIDSWLAETG